MKPADAVRHVSPARPSFRPDQPVSDLGFAEQLLIWALRVQWTDIGDGKERSLVLHHAFGAMDMPEGATLIAELVGALAQATARPLSIPCPKWRVLTSDEARLLAFIASLQSHDGTPLADFAPEWRAGHGASIWAPAQRLALALSASGLFLGLSRMSETRSVHGSLRIH